ncbi:type I restriction-modification system, S subunit [Streptococcus pneumoniae]|nr:type I restriction-modification system, S subunit [Streptococcus pneumoniae]
MKKVKLGEVATFINGYAFKPQDWSSEGREIIRIQNLTKTSTEINYYSGTIDKKYIVEAGDILISWSGTLGVFQWCGRSAVLNQHIFKVVFDKIDIDKSYFKYVVEKGLQDAVKHTHGSTMKHLTKKYFDNIIVPYTNLGEQQRIASELDLLSKLILRRQEQLEELNLLVKSRFNEMFGDVILNEKEWKVSKWNEILTIRNGKNQKQVEDADGKFPIYGSGGIMGYAKDWIVKKNSVIIGRKGNINKPILVRENFWNVDTAFGLEPVLEKINSEYLFYFCQLYNFEKLNKAVTIPSLTKSDLLNISIRLPPLALQNEFADFVVQVDKSQFIIHVLRNNNYSRVISGSAQPQLPITKLKKILLRLPPLALQNEFADFVAQVDKSQYLREHSTGATIPHLNKNILLDLQLELLGIEEQENIICILNTIKRLITKRKLQLDELNLLVKSRFNEMFGENKIFESIDNLFDIIDGDRGKNYPKSDELFSEEYCLFLNTKNVTKNGFSFDTKQFITKTKDKLLRKGKLERYDIVLTTRGTVGNVAYYDELIKYKHLRINSGMVILRPKTPNLNQKFACEIAIKVWRNSLKFSII